MPEVAAPVSAIARSLQLSLSVQPLPPVAAWSASSTARSVLASSTFTVARSVESARRSGVPASFTPSVIVIVSEYAASEAERAAPEPV